MGKEIAQLEPQLLWSNFYSLTQIPRPSKYENKALDFIAEYGRGLGLEVVRDNVGNVIIRKPATVGMEDRPGVILQAHADMVPQKRTDSNHDFLTDAIETILEGNIVKANGTTLGADNGIGVAATMAVLADNTLVHPELEVLITTDEETGMTGAFGMQSGMLQGKVLLNLDSEEEGDIYIGCAGGVNVTSTFRYSKVETAEDDIAVKVMISGLKGGHSGLDINLGRANANKLLFRFLKFAVANYEAMLVEVNGGNMRNAIPREAYAVLTIDKDDKDDFVEAVEEFEEMFREEYAKAESDLTFECCLVERPQMVIDEMSADDLINAVQGSVNGVVKMSSDVEGLVETSSNMAIVETKDEVINVKYLVRSAVDSSKEDVVSTLESVCRLAGAEVETDGEYPGWKPNKDSVVLRKVSEVYNSLYGISPKVKAIHAGLECGILGATYPEWDMISFGPTIRYPHSPSEYVEVDSVKRFWNLLVQTLKEL